MDLIYTDDQGTDVGVLFDYDMDMEYGTTDASNDFELSMNLSNHCMKDDCMVYIEGTDYGGVIDDIEVNTGTDKVKYHGRTWHGVWNSRVIAPEGAAKEYSVSNMDANDVIRELIDVLDLQQYFYAPEEISGIEIALYSFRYDKAYDGLCNMLHEYGAKLMMEVDAYGKVKCYAEEYADFSEVDDWDSSQYPFVIQKKYNPVNHLVCVSDGEDESYAIHLFTDEEGSLQPYSLKDDPIEDADYITDQTYRTVTGSKEVAEVLEISTNAVQNYKYISEMPKDWHLVYDKYCEQTVDDDGNVKYEDMKGIEKSSYDLTTSRPSKWNEEYSNYTTRSTELDEDGNYSYSQVSGNTTYDYVLQKSMPVDWNKNYGQYYYYHNNGRETKIENVPGSKSSGYKKQKSKPTDWNTNCNKYYFKKLYAVTKNYTNPKKKSKSSQESAKMADLKKSYSDFKLYKITRKKKSGRYGSFTIYYHRTSTYSTVQKVNGKAPKWKQNKYYTKLSDTGAPKWVSNKYYTRKVTGTVAPAWESGLYYSVTTTTIAPAFTDNIYLCVDDHYAKMVEEGTEWLFGAWNSDSIEIDFPDDDDDVYDIGDVVGAIENRTKLQVWQPITRKVIKLSGGDMTVEYQIGG